jgi:hypothetical protein
MNGAGVIQYPYCLLFVAAVAAAVATAVATAIICVATVAANHMGF